MMRWLDREGGFAEAALTAVAALLLLCVIDLVRDRVAALPRYRVASNLVDLSGSPLIVENYAEEICGTGPLLDRPRSLLDRELPRLACAALERSAWVRRVVRVR